jgi:tetratricopeptide (TPR) repeat protein
LAAVVEAAGAAMAKLAYEDAAELYEAALGVAALAHVDPVPALVGVASASAAAGDRDRARRALLRAADVAREAGRADALAQAALGFAGPGFEVDVFDPEQLGMLEEARGLLGSTPLLVLRSRVAARLSVALSLSGQDERRAVLADEAIELAERAADASALAHALAARCDVCAGPAQVAARRRDSTRIIEQATSIADRAIELLGRRQRIVAALEAGDLVAADRDVSELARVADLLGQPRYQWYVPLWRGARFAARGRLAEQAVQLEAAATLGHRAGSPNVEILVLSQRWFTMIEVGDVEGAAESFERDLPEDLRLQLGVQMVPSTVLHLVVSGRVDEALGLLESTAAELRAYPPDSEWLPMVAQLADVATRLGGHPIGAWAYEALTPFAELWAVEGIGAYLHGPVHRHLGCVAALAGDTMTAAAHFDAALTALRRAGADLLVARTLYDRGVMLADTDALRAASTLYAVLGAQSRVADIAKKLTPPSLLPGTGPNAFLREGDGWCVRFNGGEARIRDAKGMHDLARLLARPGVSVPAVELAEPPGGGVREGDLGSVIDGAARAAYRARLVELDEELEAADAAADAARSARLAAERDALIDQLAGAYGLGGRARRPGSTAERARTTVTSRIRDAIRRLDALDPSLGRHLDRSVNTGTLCVYEPEEPTIWET